MPFQACSIDEPALFHVTKKNRLEAIRKEGLIPDLSDLTKEAYIGWKTDELGLDDDTNDDIKEDAEKLPYIVFAADRDSLPAAISMVSKNIIDPTPLQDIVVLGIAPRCQKQFVRETIGSDIDYISKTTIPAACLFEIDEREWKPYYEREKRLYL